ncbi:hypothetical protein DMC47_36540 [Nostoc sp. 3335mG]|nr:hypothetical protein DMC47_36540 [Nostoc sp. 3335mG]
MAAIARLPDFPTRTFKSRYWDVPDGPTIYAYVSDEVRPLMVAVDLQDIRSSPALETVASRMRAAEMPFRDTREVRAGVTGRFLVAEVGA